MLVTSEHQRVTRASSVCRSDLYNSDSDRRPSGSPWPRACLALGANVGSRNCTKNPPAAHDRGGRVRPIGATRALKQARVTSDGSSHIHSGIAAGYVQRIPRAWKAPLITACAGDISASSVPNVSRYGKCAADPGRALHNMGQMERAQVRRGVPPRSQCASRPAGKSDESPRRTRRRRRCCGCRHGVLPR